MPILKSYEAGKNTIYQIRVKTLPNLINNVYAIVEEDGITLIDAGCGKKTAAALNKAIRKISSMHHKELKRIIITHSHIDHFGAINRIKGNSQPMPICLMQIQLKISKIAFLARKTS